VRGLSNKTSISKENCVDWIEVNGAVLRYEMSGEGDEVLVLIHHMGGTLESWAEILPQLNHTRRVLRFDMRGAGLSEKIRGTADIDVLVSDISALLDALGIKGKVSAVGIAIGGAVAIRFAARYGERVNSIVVTSPATGIPVERRPRTLKFADNVEQQGIRALADEIMTRTYPVVLRSNSKAFEDARSQLISNDSASLAGFYRMLAHLEMEEDFPKVRCATLVLAGSHDEIRPPSGVEKLALSLPNARFQVLESGHIMSVQSPQLLATSTNDFLGELKS
jgi:3-oxoadipate enol-lactonase